MRVVGMDDVVSCWKDVTSLLVSIASRKRADGGLGGRGERESEGQEGEHVDVGCKRPALVVWMRCELWQRSANVTTRSERCNGSRCEAHCW